jgi:hypothetical protein
MSVSGDTILIAAILLALGLTLICLKVHLLLFRLAASLCWLALGVLLLTGSITGISLSDNWVYILALLFIVMTVAPLSLQFITDIRHERQVRDRFGRPHMEYSTEWKRSRKAGKPSSSERQAEYRMQTRNTVSRGRSRTRGGR